MNGMVALTVMGGLLMVGTTAVAEEVAQRNLLKNASFKTAANPGFPDYWGGQSGWREKTHELVPDAFVPGTLSMRLSNHDGKKVVFSTGNYGWSPGTDGTVYTFSVYLKSDPPGLVATIGSDRLERKNVEPEGGWKLFSVTAPLKPRKGYMGRFLPVEIELLKGKTGTLLVNAPVLVRGDASVDYRAATPEPGKPAAAEKKAGPVRAALVGEWVLGETAERDGEGRVVIKDTGGRGTHGYCLGEPSWVKTPFGSALAFGGKSCVVVPYAPTLDGKTDECSFELLLKPDSGKAMPVFIRGMHMGGYALRIAYGKYQPIVGPWRMGASASVLPQAEHLVATFARPHVRIYLNGEEAGEGEEDVALSPAAGKRPLVIGGFDVWSKEKGYNPQPGFEGWIRLVRIYDRALSEREVADLRREVMGR